MPTIRFLNHLRARLLGPPAPRLGTSVKLLVILEGQDDLAFLRRISHILHADSTLPDLVELERTIAPTRGGCPLTERC